MANEIALRNDDLALRPNYPASRLAQRETIKLRYVQIIYRNFSGKPGPFNEEGERSFSILLPEETALDLTARGLNVKALRLTDPDDPQMYHLPVAVSYRRRPPRVYMVTGDGERMPLRKALLSEDMVGMMDNLELGECHMMIAISNYEVRGTKGKKCYLQSFFGHILQDELEQEYATVEDMVEDDLQQHHDEDNVIDGEIVND